LISSKNPHLRSADDATDHFNRVIATLLFGGMVLDQVTPEELAFGTLFDTGYFCYDHALGAIARIQRAFGERAAGSEFTIDLLNPPRIFCNDVENAFKAGLPIMTILVQIDPAALLMALSYHRTTQHRNSLIYAWTIIEQAIDQIWTDIFIGDTKKIKLQSRARSLNSVAKNISTKIEFLFQVGLLSDKIFRYLQQGRSARNNFIHKGDKPKKADSFVCLQAAIGLIKIICDAQEVKFDESVLIDTVKDKKPNNTRGIAARAGDLDWSEVQYYKVLKKIPGDEKWVGDFEIFPDIQLQGHEFTKPDSDAS
jgi:hypothetical protein